MKGKQMIILLLPGQKIQKQATAINDFEVCEGGRH
jgi:hypothetical protein